MAGTTRRVAPVALAVLVLASGCGGSDAPSPEVAGDRLAGWMQTLGQELTRGVRPLQPWTPTEDGSQSDTDGCGDGTLRRSYVATVEVPASGTPDAGNRANLLAGQLADAGWDPSQPETDGTSGGFTALRSGTDSTRSKLALEFSAVTGGWRYQVTAKTACLEKP